MPSEIYHMNGGLHKTISIRLCVYPFQRRIQRATEWGTRGVIAATRQIYQMPIINGHCIQGKRK